MQFNQLHSVWMELRLEDIPGLEDFCIKILQIGLCKNLDELTDFILSTHYKWGYCSDDPATMDPENNNGYPTADVMDNDYKIIWENAHPGQNR